MNDYFEHDSAVEIDEFDYDDYAEQSYYLEREVQQDYALYNFM